MQPLGRLALRRASRICILNWRFYSADSTERSTNLQPSKVLHFRNLRYDVTEADIRELLQPFGSVTKAAKMKEQLLVQMQDLEQAKSIIDHFATEQPLVRGKKVYVKYSEHEELTRPEEEPGKMLFVFIVNPMYAINVPVVYRVFSPHGKIEKIAVSQKSGVIALVQFDSEESATKAKEFLDGREIFDGCCRMEINYSRLEELTISCNNEMTRDFTENELPSPRSGHEKSILGLGFMEGERVSAPVIGNEFNPDRMNLGFNRKKILFVGHLNPDIIDEDKLYNLFSPYGVVLKIKLLSRKDQAMVEMNDGFQAELALNYLRGTVLYGKSMEISYSKQTYLHNQMSKDYTMGLRGRFFPEFAKNCSSPSKVIHAASLPADIEEQELIKHFAPYTIHELRIFDSLSKTGKKQALLEFQSTDVGIQVLVQKQFSMLKDSLIRLSFSSTRIVPDQLA